MARRQDCRRDVRSCVVVPVYWEGRAGKCRRRDQEDTQRHRQELRQGNAFRGIWSSGEQIPARAYNGRTALSLALLRIGRGGQRDNLELELEFISTRLTRAAAYLTVATTH